MTYRDLDADGQVDALRPVATAAAEEFGLDVVALELVAHSYNTTFAVTCADGRRLALRVNTNSKATLENVVAQQAWQGAIAAETEVLVAEPLTTVDGAWYASVRSDVLARPVVVTAAAWLDAPDVGRLEPVTAYELGRSMATLHAQAQDWEPPLGTGFPRFEDPLFGDPDLLTDPPGLGPDDRSLLDRAREVASAAFTELYAGAEVRPLHADLHGGNLKWDGARLAVFDFDDAGLGLPVLDLAITTFYLRDGDPAPEEALRLGYADVMPLPEVEPRLFEALVASRQLLLANALLSSSTAEWRAEAESYLATSVSRLRHWLETGAFTRAPSAV